MTTLAETFALKGRSIETAAAYAQQYLDEHCQQILQDHRSELEAIRDQAGDRAYASYARKLFGPLYDEFKEARLTCDPGLPGSFPLSREQWGPQEQRERRFWCVLREENGAELGTLVTRFFHDHTQLRIPRSPAVLGWEQTNQTIIAQMVESSRIPGLTESV
jgi:hypothetical protein